MLAAVRHCYNSPMLKFDDFFHLPQLDDCIAELARVREGVIIIAGLDPRLHAASGDLLLPSGRATMFRALVGTILNDEMLTAAIVAGQRDAVRVGRSQQRRVRSYVAQGIGGYAAQIVRALERKPTMLIVDRLDSDSAPATFAAAQSGVCVLAQLDSVCRGREVAHHLEDHGVAPELVAQLGWVVAVERLPTLCRHCRQPATPSAAQLNELRDMLRNLPDVTLPKGGITCFSAPGCAHCEFRGRLGDVAVFDIYRAAAPATAVLPRELYLWELVQRGMLALDDMLTHAAQQLYRTYHQLSHSAEALAEANSSLQRNIVQLESANRVLEQRTAALRSLQDIGQALTRSTDLADLVERMGQQASELCGADRVIFYLARPRGEAEVLAVHGWQRELLKQRIQFDAAPAAGGEPTIFNGWPPGVPEQHADLAGFTLRAGLRVALVSEGHALGHMIIQSTQKARFAPAEIALAGAFADQAALAIRRADLLDARLRQERLEHELEMARRVQQSVLPRVFPQLHDFSFSACNKPARAVGGDLYDVFWRDDDHIGIVIADVSGKGMPAALYMALTRSLLLAEARREPSPRAVLLSVNQLLRELGDPQMFVTVFYGVIDRATRMLTYARAGHDYPVLLRNGVAKLLEGGGLVLGAFDQREIPLEEIELQLEPGDQLALYTDGLTDVFGPGGERFELERLQALFLRHAGATADALCDSTFDDLAVFQGNAEQFDDMTLLVVGVR